MMEVSIEDTILTGIYSVLLGLFFSYLIMVIAVALLSERRDDDDDEADGMWPDGIGDDDDLS